MIDITDKKMLESRFAEDFSSPFYPLLADMYLSEGDLIRARKVCETGLDHDSENIDGKFVYAKVQLAEKKFTVAEKWLKQVVEENTAHFGALRLLISLEFQLKRSHKTIQNYINRLLHFLPQDNECMEWLKIVQSTTSQQNHVKNKDNPSTLPLDVEAGENVALNKKSEPSKDKTYNIEESMATFTMIQVLKSQQHYNQALTVLGVLESTDQDNNKIIQEKNEILQLISESKK